VALVTLTLVEFLRSDAPLPHRKEYEQDLDAYLKFLLSLRMDDGRFHSAYRFSDGKGLKQPSPYYDGETLLALVKAARYAGHEELKRPALESAQTMHEQYVTAALARGGGALQTCRLASGQPDSK
jgi:hypothetical protein